MCVLVAGVEYASIEHLCSGSHCVVHTVLHSVRPSLTMFFEVVVVMNNLVCDFCFVVQPVYVTCYSWMDGPSQYDLSWRCYGCKHRVICYGSVGPCRRGVNWLYDCVCDPVVCVHESHLFDPVVL